MILDVASLITDCIAATAAFAILIFGICGVLYGLGSLLHDIWADDEEEEE